MLFDLWIVTPVLLLEFKFGSINPSMICSFICHMVMMTNYYMLTYFRLIFHILMFVVLRQLKII
jgi:hypothetical protein